MAHKVRPIPHLMQVPLQKELNRLIDLGIIEPIDSSQWLAPIVITTKPASKEVRLCSDLRGLNKNILVDRHPLPRIYEILTLIKDASYFSILDQSSAYHQVELHPESRHLTSFITPLGAFQYLRMPFGLASAAAAFQRIMQHILKDVPGTLCFQDDILIHGKDIREHNDMLTQVLHKLRKAGLTLKKEKCQIGVSSVEYLGHTISCEGIKPKMNLVDASLSTVAPTNVDELKSFLGLSEYYFKFIQNNASLVEPLRNLLRARNTFQWDENCQAAFQAIKARITNAPFLGRFDPMKVTFLSTDASNKGLGASLIQRVGDKEHVVAFASRSLKGAELHYCEVEKEALACSLASRHFIFFLWGIPFTVLSDHKPLTYVFTTKGSNRTTPRISKWILGLQSYNFRVEYVPGKQNVVADFLSRAPLNLCNDTQEEEENDMVLEVQVRDKNNWDDCCVRAQTLPLLKKYIMEGWPPSKLTLPEVVSKYWEVRLVLGIIKGTIYRGETIVPPKDIRRKIVDLAHVGHLGGSLTKSKVREEYWWPGMDTMVEDLVKTCYECAKSDKTLWVKKPPLSPVKVPDLPWLTSLAHLISNTLTNGSS